MIHVDNLSFAYKDKQLFQDLSLHFKSGECIGLIGENGSGKSSFFQLLLGFLEPSRGKIIKESMHIGCAFQEAAFPENLRCVELLNYVRAHYKRPYSLQDLAQRFDLGGFLSQPVGRLSGGQRQRLALALAFTGRPDIVFLDEPSSGLDADSREHLMRAIKEYREEKPCLVLLISHHPDEIASQVSKFLKFSSGKNPIALDPEAFMRLCMLKEVSYTSCGERHREVVEDSDEVVRRLVGNRPHFEDLQIRNLGLEEVFSRCDR